MTGISTLTDEQVLDHLADRLAPKLLSRMEKLAEMKQSPEYVKGSLDIARFLGVSEDTFRRRHKLLIPVCGYEEYNHRGQQRIRPICKADDLRRYMENLRSKKISR